ncbi:MAG: trypsin-like peptidase domain-containing protein, partial [Xanthomonadales bacterium]|nr:trypsin-like peptidase domain-containing protein [Xanthomonadales bacterium]
MITSLIQPLTRAVRVLIILFLAGGAGVMTGCDQALTDTAEAPTTPPPVTDDADLRAKIVQDREIMEARRRAYLEEGIVPDVPSSLSDDPRNPEFIFEGYSTPATAAEALAAQERAGKADDEPDVADKADAPKDLGVFINPATGEMWRWKPANVKQRVAELRALSKEGGSETETPGYAGAGTVEEDGVPFEESASKIIGNSDQRQIRSKTSGHSMTSYPWRAIGGLNPDGQNSNSPNALCTATKIGPRHLLTSGHCVHTGGGGGSFMWRDWWPGQDGMDKYVNGGDPSPKGVYNIQWYWVHSDWINSGQNNKDYAVLILYDSPSAVGLGWFGLKVDNTLANTSAWNFGYPSWGNTCENSTYTNNSCRNSMWGMSEKIVSTSLSYAYYKHDTQGGHSGSPVYQYNGGNRQIIAVHKGESVTTNRGIKITN